MSIEEQLHAYLLVTHLSGEDPGALTEETDLLDSGVLDSHALVQIAAHLEREYGIPIGPDELAPENFRSISALAAFVRSKRSPPGG